LQAAGVKFQYVSLKPLFSPYGEKHNYKKSLDKNQLFAIYIGENTLNNERQTK